MICNAFLFSKKIMSNKVTIKRTKKTQNQVYDVSFSGLTAGEIRCIKNALEAHATNGSVVAADVYGYLQNGMQAANDPYL